MPSTTHYELASLQYNFQAHCGDGSMLLAAEVVDALRTPRAAVREVLRIVTKVLVLEAHRGHSDSERPHAHGHRACLNDNFNTSSRFSRSTMVELTTYSL